MPAVGGTIVSGVVRLLASPEKSCLFYGESIADKFQKTEDTKVAQPGGLGSGYFPTSAVAGWLRHNAVRSGLPDRVANNRSTGGDRCRRQMSCRSMPVLGSGPGSRCRWPNVTAGHSPTALRCGTAARTRQTREPPRHPKRVPPLLRKEGAFGNRPVITGGSDPQNAIRCGAFCRGVPGIEGRRGGRSGLCLFRNRVCSRCLVLRLCRAI